MVEQQAAMMSQESFYISYGGREDGPFPVPVLQEMARQGNVKGDTMLRPVTGNELVAAKMVPGLLSDKEWMTTLLISWFAGMMGIDRFYLGHTGLGIAKLLTCGGVGIWHLIDFILIALNKVNDA